VAKRFVAVGKVKLTATDGGDSMQLIYGDELDTVGSTAGEVLTVRHRGRRGTVPKGAVDSTPRLECYFLDVGQGDATLIVTPGRKTILIDGGKGVGSGRASEAEQTLIWKYRLDEATEPWEIDLVVFDPRRSVSKCSHRSSTNRLARMDCGGSPTRRTRSTAIPSRSASPTGTCGSCSQATSTPEANDASSPTCP
jgi:hypothetical protein